MPGCYFVAARPYISSIFVPLTAVMLIPLVAMGIVMSLSSVATIVAIALL